MVRFWICTASNTTEFLLDAGDERLLGVIGGGVGHVLHLLSLSAALTALVTQAPRQHTQSYQSLGILLHLPNTWVDPIGLQRSPSLFLTLSAEPHPCSHVGDRPHTVPTAGRRGSRVPKMNIVHQRATPSKRSRAIQAAACAAFEFEAVRKAYLIRFISVPINLNVMTAYITRTRRFSDKRPRGRDITARLHLWPRRFSDMWTLTSTHFDPHKASTVDAA
ncbi:unnamed protein product [Lepeophtheirus salmonis]|uniref:(salmon louse) hypothetical protein n=1 Tax=Lepeophtheirus salmonis TaxID=72036 RepID=A0A7R8CM20_LEPSM|nr:unnamed protein product [Lepeophtheirus salmonis]CAF2862593.1 unnamed protein product [Lepeophtheirus salmonis]